MALLPAATGMMRGLAIAARAIAAVVAHAVAVSVDEVHAADKLSHLPASPAKTQATRSPWNMQCRSLDAAPDCAATATAGTASVATSAVLNAKSAILLLFI